MTGHLLNRTGIGCLTVALLATVSLRQVAQTPSTDGKQLLMQSTSSSVAGQVVDMHEVAAGETLHILVGRSMVLRNVSNIRRIYVGNPAVLQSYTASPSEIVLTAKAAGISSLVIWNAAGVSHLYTVAADVDPGSLLQSLHEAYPTSNISVEGREGRVYLSGTVPTQEIAESAARLATSYAKDVVSSLRVVLIHEKQVQMKLRIVEVDRTRMEQYGVNVFAGGKVPFSLTTGQYPSASTGPGSGSGTGSGSGSVTVSNPLNVFLYSTGLNMGVTVQDLEQKQILQVLAEPTLTAMSGHSAKFLSGGEFPVPVVQGGASGAAPVVTIMFQPFGVRVDFTPTVNADGSIRLKVAPEVSTLDYANGVSISGFTVPALSTRRAETEVEIQSGQSFAVSGLLDHRTTENLSQMPGISNIPILGKLFASKSYSHSIVELVVLVTATVVDPLTNSGSPVEPTFAVPNMVQSDFDKQLSKEQRISPKQH